MKSILLYLRLTFVCFFCLPLFAQMPDIQFRRISIREGLSTTIVITVIKDRQGFLWFGTMVGLNRYDGYQFRVFKNDPRDSTSISDDWINSVIVSRTGDLWIGTQNGGLNRYDYFSETFTAYLNKPNDSTSLTDKGVMSLCEDSDGTIWIGTYSSGLCWKKSSENIIRHFQKDSLLPAILTGTSVTSILEDNNGDLWVGTSQGLARLNKDEKETGKYFLYDDHHFTPAPNKNVKAIKKNYMDSRGILYVAIENGGLYAYEREKDLFSQCSFGLKSKDVLKIVANCVIEDNAGRYWIGTPEEGLFLINPKDKSMRQFQYRNNDEKSLSSNTIYTMYEDDAGIMWFGTFDGISSYNNREKQFVTHLYRADNPNGLNAGLVMDLCEDANGGLWCATHGGGLNYLPHGSSNFTYFRHSQNDHSSLSTDMLLCMTRIRDNIIWLGSRGGGLMKFDIRTKKTKRFVHDPNNPSSISDNTIFYIYQDRKGNVWIGTSIGGLDKFNPANETFTHYRNKPNDDSSLSGNNIWSILEDHKGYIWVGTQRSGLNRLDPKTGKCIRFLRDPSNPKSIQSNSIYAIHEYPQGVLWIGTTGGLNRLDLNSNEFQAYTMKDGLADNGIGSILHDSKGRLWLAAKYLSMLDPQTEKIRNFDEGDGIICGEINQESACIGRDGRMFFGASDGYVVFHPDSIYDNTYIPPVVLTNFKIFEKSKKLPKDHTAGIVLSYEENYFSFEFAALSFTAPKKNMYKYKLEGFDKDWIFSGTRRYASYTRVDPGDYIFRVQGSNNDGVWNTQGAAIAVHVIPPYWKTLWFRFSVISIIIFSIVFAVCRRIEFLKRRAKAQQELSRQLLESQENERKRIGAGLHDSLGQNLLVIKNLAVIGLEGSKNQKSTDEQLAEISQLASQSLAEVREISYNLRPYHLDQLGLTGALRSIISRIASSSHINFSEDLDDLDNLFPKEQEINIFRIIQEAVNNIVKHSRAASASVQIKRNKDSILCIVADNGIGFDQTHQGFGLTGMAERVRILGGSFAVKSDSGFGTTITVTIPLQKLNAD